jgi:glycosyltransferase involved in cell wall biosynthesis
MNMSAQDDLCVGGCAKVTSDDEIAPDMNFANVLFLSTSPWASPYWFRRQHFARHLARRGQKVLYVDPQKSSVQLARQRGVGALVRPEHKSRLDRISEGGHFAVFRPPLAWPYHVRSRTGSVLNKCRLAVSVRATAWAFFGGESYVQVVYHPVDLLVTDRRQPILYEIVDRFDAYPEYADMRSFIYHWHCRACALASKIVVTAESLIPAGFEEKVTIIPNGVDHTLFSKGIELPCPPDLARISSPRAVYAGALLDWFDFELVTETARKLPDVQFILLGFPEREYTFESPNIHYLGQKAQSDLPAYYAHSQVGIIPFRVNDLTRDVNPLKLYEYLSAGLPCVSIPMDPIKHLAAGGVLSLVEGADAFAAAIREQRRAADEPDAIRARNQIAAQHSWDHLSRQFEQVLI